MTKDTEGFLGNASVLFARSVLTVDLVPASRSG